MLFTGVMAIVEQVPAAEQLKPVAQSAFVVQLVRQAPEEQANGKQLDVAPATQVPPPLQVLAWVTLDPLQEAGLHTVPDVYKRHAPMPLQKPSVPQVEAACCAHWFLGSIPGLTDEQLPARAGRLHA
jgi:hypothetical protein